MEKTSGDNYDAFQSRRMLELTYHSLVGHRALYAMAKLGLADIMKDDSVTSETLAKAAGTNSRALYRLLRTLSTLGVVRELDGRCFCLTQLGATLRADSPNSMRGWVLFTGDSFYLKCWERIVDAVKTGDSVWKKVHGSDLFEFLAKNPEASSIFDAAMASLSRNEVAAILEAYDFSKFRVAVDVGGGNGALLSAILNANRNLRGIIFDLPEVMEGARAHMASQGLGSRCDMIPGDFFEHIPSGGDVYILKYIIHDWADEHALKILGNVRQAVNPSTRLLLVEAVIPPPNIGQNSYAKLEDLEMLVILGGQDRTEEEYASLLRQAGFTLQHNISTSEYLSILEATITK